MKSSEYVCMDGYGNDNASIRIAVDQHKRFKTQWKMQQGPMIKKANQNERRQLMNKTNRRDVWLSDPCNAAIVKFKLSDKANLEEAIQARSLLTRATLEVAEKKANRFILVEAQEGNLLAARIGAREPVRTPVKGAASAFDSTSSKDQSRTQYRERNDQQFKDPFSRSLPPGKIGKYPDRPAEKKHAEAKAAVQDRTRRRQSATAPIDLEKTPEPPPGDEDRKSISEADSDPGSSGPPN
ncbi:MAG: hypothetical protein Q9168_006098 [Polycauliona sp. 1 TL-2023]